jgi:DNA polymerase V
MQVQFLDNKNLNINHYLCPNPVATFLMRVAGTSMIDAGIHDNDIVVVDRSKEVKSGDIIVASYKGGFVIKEYRKTATGIILVSHNPTFPAFHVDETSNFEIFGKVTGMVRQL